MDNIAFRFKASADAKPVNRVGGTQEDHSETKSRHTKRQRLDDGEPTAAAQQPSQEEPSLPPFLRLPAELRIKIYAYATSHSETLAVTSPNQPPPPPNNQGQSTPPHTGNTTTWTLPALAQVNKQLLHEVIPIFFLHNTLFIADMNRLRLWHPFRSVNHMENIAAIFFDLESSVKFSFTLKKFEIQPTMLVKEDARKVQIGKRLPNGSQVFADDEDFALVVKWEPFERAIATLAENPRPSLFLSQTLLEEAWEREGRRRKDLQAGKALALDMKIDEVAMDMVMSGEWDV